MRAFPGAAALAVAVGVALSSPAPAAAAGPVDARQGAEPTTVTAYAHPLSLTPLGRLAPTQTPLAYASPPSPIPVPGAGAAAKDHVQDLSTATATAAAAGSGPVACTSIAGSSPTATVPAFCAPSALVNAPSLLPNGTGTGTGAASKAQQAPTATTTVQAVASKPECCARCAAFYNCVAWRFVPVYRGDPTDRLPGGFDPWGGGNCEVVYHTGKSSGDDDNDDDDDGGGSGGGSPAAADVCPNGRVGSLLAGGSDNPPSAAAWDRLYYNGWNEGACGAPVGEFRSGVDDGRGDPDKLCPGSG